MNNRGNVVMPNLLETLVYIGSTENPFSTVI
jgi:hypothetical protein